MLKWVLSLLAILWLLSPSFAADDIKGGAILYVVSGASPEKDTLVANNFDYGLFDYDIGNNFWSAAGSTFVATVEAANADFRWLQYNSLTDNFVFGASDTTENDTLKAVASRLDIDIEEAYLHYLDDTTIIWDLSTPEPGDTTFHSAGDRVYLYYTSNHFRRACNFSTTEARELQIATIMAYGLRGNEPGSGAGGGSWAANAAPDGIWFDNAAAVLYNYGAEFIAGGTVAEASGLTLGTPAFNAWHFDNNIKPFLLELQDSTSAEIVINISNIWDSDYGTMHSGNVIADGYFMENQWNPIRNFGVDAPQTAFQRDEAIELTGAFSWQSSALTTGVCDSTVTNDEAILASLAFYLASRGDNSLWNMKGTNSIADSNWYDKNWVDAIYFADDYLGSPIGDIYLLQSGTDPKGNTYKVWARDYTNGIAWTRARGDYDECIGSDTAVTVNLDGPFRPLEADGTRAERDDSFQAENGSAGILVDAYGEVLDVGQTYNEIQDAIDAAFDGDIVQVTQEEFYDQIFVNKQVTIQAAPTKTPVIRPSAPAVACSITADGVTLEGLTIYTYFAGSSETIVFNQGIGTTLEDCTIAPSAGQTATTAIEGHYGLTLLNSTLAADSWGIGPLASPSGPAPEGTIFRMEGCTLDGGGVDLEDSITSVIDDSTIRLATTGIAYDNCGGSLSNTLIEGCTYGIVVADVTGELVIDSSDVVDCTYGILIEDDSDSLSISEVSISGDSNGVAGMKLNVSSGTPSILSNTVSGYSVGRGMLLTAGTATLEKNEVSYCKYGMDISTSTQTTLGDPSDSGSDNEVHHNTSFGIKVGSSGDVLAYNNKIYNNGTGVYFTNGSSGNLGDMIQDGRNSIYSNTRFCIDNSNTSGWVPAYGNWWGSCSAPTCTSGNVLTGSWLCYQPASGGNVPVERVDDAPSAVLSASPNPTGHLSALRYRLAESAETVRVDIFDVQGRLVRSMTERDVRPGAHELNWDLRTDAGARVRTGVYWMRVQTDGVVLDTKQVVVTSAAQEEE